MKLLLLVIFIIVGAHTVCADSDFSAVDRYVTAAKNEVGLPSGTAIAVVRGGEIVYEAYFGYTDIEARKKVSEASAFYIASATKPLFALSALLMENRGYIKDSTSMSEMFPSLHFSHLSKKTKNKIQMQHLISHSHALDNLPMEDALAFTGQHNRAQRQTLAAATKIRTDVKLGEFSYSNLGYNLLSVWVENYFNQDWQKMLDKLVYQPLSMKHTSSYISDAAKKGFELARPYHLYAKNPQKPLPFEKSDITMQAAGGAITSARDLAKFLITHLNAGKVDGKQIFPAKVIAKSHQQLASNDLKYRDFVRKGYAWGWYIGPYKEEKMFHHFGGMKGSHAHTSFMLEHNIGLVVLNNEDVVGKVMTNAIADIVYSILLSKGDVNAVTNARIDEIKKVWQATQADIKETFTNIEKRNASRVMTLSQEKINYAGVFYNPLWGSLKVKLLQKTKQLEFTLGELNAIATAAKKPDELRIQFPVMRNGMIASYRVLDGKLSEIHVYGLNRNVEIFTRVSK